MAEETVDHLRETPDFKDFAKIYRSRARLVSKEAFMFLSFQFPKDGPHNIDCDIPPFGSVIVHSDDGETGVRCCELLSGLRIDDVEAADKCLAEKVTKFDKTDEVMKKLRLTGTTITDITIETVTHKNVLFSHLNTELVKNVFLATHIFRPLLVDSNMVVHSGSSYATGIMRRCRCRSSNDCRSTVYSKSLHLGSLEILNCETELLIGMKDERKKNYPVTLVAIKHDETELQKCEKDRNSDESDVESDGDDDEIGVTDFTKFEELPSDIGSVPPAQFKAVSSGYNRLHGFLPYAARITAMKLLLFSVHEKNIDGSKVHFCFLCGTQGLYALVYHSEYDVMLMTSRLADWKECHSLALLWFILNRKYFGLADIVHQKLKDLQDKKKLDDLRCGFKDYVNGNEYLKSAYGALKKYPVQLVQTNTKSRKRPIPVYLEDM